MADLAPQTELLHAMDSGDRGSDGINRLPAPVVEDEGEDERESQILVDQATAATFETDTPLPEQHPEPDEAVEPRAYYHDTDERPHSSSSSHPSATFTGDDDDFDQEDRHASRSISSHSSISSLPGSVVVYPSGKHNSNGTVTPSNFRGHYMQHYSGRNNDDYTPGNSNGSKKNNYSSRLSKFSPGLRDRDSPFRHPSSVRAMQMGDEEEYDGYGHGYDNEELTPSRSRKHRGGGRGHSCQSVSGMSMRSLVSTPPSAKRNYKSPRAKEEPAQKEYPLVLLHCTLLPPSLSLPQGLGRPSAQLLEEVLPEKYWARWKLLEDKIVNSGVLRDRGLLISHPQEMYDLLEERLLESLELVRPRLGYGHFFGRETEDTADDGAEASGAKEDCGDSSDGYEGEKCADCGAKVLRQLDGEKRKWELRVYAANGLMKAGAWAAAWREMEKVDVEVGLALPVEIKRELERRIIEEGMIKIEEERRLSEEEKRRREIYGEPTPPTQEAIDGLEDDDIVPPFQSDFDRSVPPPSFEQPESPPKAPFMSTYERGRDRGPAKSKEVDLQTLCANYIRVLASDRRNVALAFLSILVLYLSVGVGKRNDIFMYHATSSRQPVPPNSSIPMVIEHNTPSVVGSPVIGSIEPNFSMNSAAGDRSTRSASACGSQSLSADVMQLQQPPQSHQAPSHSTPIYQSKSPYIEDSVQSQTQPPASSKSAAADVPNDTTPSNHDRAIHVSDETVAQHPTPQAILNPNVMTEHYDLPSSAQIIELA
ncbi:hypothetical protein AJ78_01495 [Emergomyces pasteurianus Ep9510]|uniref:Pathway-specific nitrogen regulator n=1 Tax=Emergomyces pasteurianus Ep9510 TaxID=1447872 RepID=A0A1J9PRG5_9EURO|nr:hypothetical protein AJ78_01495 [Emergomyces pasteurianus Ep9510]